MKRFSWLDVTSRINIAVVGDIMMDRYVRGRVNRISEEAPVPISIFESSENILGGAANTAANVKALGCNVYLSGMLGQDKTKDEVLNLLDDKNINRDAVFARKNHYTTVKTRFLNNSQQIMRLDNEEKLKISEAESDSILLWLESLCENLNSVIISDYGKGVVSNELTCNIISLCNKRNIPVLIDPKGIEWEKYSNAFALTPNVKELSKYCGYLIENKDESIVEAGARIRKKLNLDYLIVTRSEKGITCIGENKIIHCPAFAKDVFDVSGAGDTVISVIATAIACGVEMSEILEAANIAASIAISHVGTYQVKKSELENYCGDFKNFKSVFNQNEMDEFIKLIKKWKNEGEKIVFTNGCFDLLHRGHVTYLKKAAQLGTRFIVGVNSDKSVSRLKGKKRPIQNIEDRVYILNELPYIDAIVVFDEDTPLNLISLLKPDVLVKGGDYKKDEIVGRNYAKEVIVIPFIENCSTTNIINKILKINK